MRTSPNKKLKVYITEFLFAWQNLHNVLISIAKLHYDCNFPSLCFDEPIASNFTSGWVQNRETKNGGLGMIVTSFQELKFLEKQIFPTFSYFLINSQILYHFFHNQKMTEKSVFRKASSDVTIIPSLLFLVSGLVPSRRWNLTLLVHQNTGKENRYRNIFLLLISTL